MARCLGMIFAMLTAALVLSSAAAQETRKGKFDAEAIFKKLDANNDGKLQKDEFLKLADRTKDKERAREKLVATFTMIDAEKVGYLSREQFRSYLDAARKKS